MEVRTRADLRAWLDANHGREAGLWLVTFMKPSPHAIPNADLVEELLCWGWIDTRPRKVDTSRSAVWIAPRRPGSAWSAVNKALVAAARASGAMTPAGEARIAEATANGMWSFLDDVERLEVPSDLAKALKVARATQAWDVFPRSVKRATLEWIKTAKQAQTRAKRIQDVADRAAQGQRPTPFSR
ncbi:MAG: YdeI/OmpD-associated family protein [Pseudomonadota bacterium]